MQTRLLSDTDFKNTMAEPMVDVTQSATNVIDIWPYVGAIPVSDLEGHEVKDGLVEYVYRSESKAFDHVLVTTTAKNVYLAVVVDLSHERIAGHRLMDLNALYAT